MKLPPASMKASRTCCEPGSSEVQPKVLPPSASGKILRSEVPIKRIEGPFEGKAADLRPPHQRLRIVRRQPFRSRMRARSRGKLHVSRARPPSPAPPHRRRPPDLRLLASGSVVHAT